MMTVSRAARKTARQRARVRMIRRLRLRGGGLGSSGCESGGGAGGDGVCGGGGEIAVGVVMVNASG